MITRILNACRDWLCSFDHMMLVLIAATLTPFVWAYEQVKYRVINMRKRMNADVDNAEGKPPATKYLGIFRNRTMRFWVGDKQRESFLKIELGFL